MEKIGKYWEKHTVLDPATGELFNRYFYKRKRALRFEVNTPKASVLAGYVLIEKDLRNALTWLITVKELVKNDPQYSTAKGHIKRGGNKDLYDKTKGLFVAAITFYGKCYSQCKGRKIKLDKRTLDEKYHDIHDAAILLRNNFAAHSGSEKYEFVNVIVAVDAKKRELPLLGTELSQPDSYLGDTLDEFIGLLEYVKGFVDKKKNQTSDMVYEDDILPNLDKYGMK